MIASSIPTGIYYGEIIAGVTIIRAFGASTNFLRDMLCCVDKEIFYVNAVFVLIFSPSFFYL